jgi:hypothetical protein
MNFFPTNKSSSFEKFESVAKFVKENQYHP